MKSHKNEVRSVLRLRCLNRQLALDYLELQGKTRNREVVDKLQQDVLQQWKLGNRGEDGDWREAVTNE